MPFRFFFKVIAVCCHQKIQKKNNKESEKQDEKRKLRYNTKRYCISDWSSITAAAAVVAAVAGFDHCRHQLNRPTNQPTIRHHYYYPSLLALLLAFLPQCADPCTSFSASSQAERNMMESWCKIVAQRYQFFMLLRYQSKIIYSCMGRNEHQHCVDLLLAFGGAMNVLS